MARPRTVREGRDRFRFDSLRRLRLSQIIHNNVHTAAAEFFSHHPSLTMIVLYIVSVASHAALVLLDE